MHEYGKSTTKIAWRERRCMASKEEKREKEWTGVSIE